MTIGDGRMAGATRASRRPIWAAVAAEIAGAVPVAIALINAGPEVNGPLALALSGLALFTIGVVTGAGLAAAIGVAVTAVASVMVPGEVLGAPATAAAIGAAAVGALVATDLSWWLRREPVVERAVVEAIGRRVAVAVGLGAAMAAGAGAVARAGEWSIWLLPAAIVLAAGLTVAAGFVIRRSRRHATTSLR